MVPSPIVAITYSLSAFFLQAHIFFDLIQKDQTAVCCSHPKSMDDEERKRRNRLVKRKSRAKQKGLNAGEDPKRGRGRPKKRKQAGIAENPAMPGDSPLDFQWSGRGESTTRNRVTSAKKM